MAVHFQMYFETFIQAWNKAFTYYVEKIPHQISMYWVIVYIFDMKKTPQKCFFVRAVARILILGAQEIFLPLISF